MIKKILLKLASITLVTIFVTQGLVAFNIANAKDTSEISEFTITPANLCIDENIKNGNVTAVIEEPLDFGNLKKGESVKDCTKISVCKTRASSSASDNRGKIECETFLVNSTPEAIAQVNDYFKSDTEHTTITYNQVQLFYAQSGMDMLYAYIGTIYRWGASVIGIIAVLVIVISGIQISAAGGEQSAVTSAKSRIMQSLIGIVILFLSGIILYTINPTFFTQ